MRVPHTILVDLWIVLALVVDSNELNRGVEIDILVILYSSTGELKHSHYPHNLNNLSTIISLSCAAEIYIRHRPSKLLCTAVSREEDQCHLKLCKDI